MPARPPRARAVNVQTFHDSEVEEGGGSGEARGVVRCVRQGRKPPRPVAAHVAARHAENRQERQGVRGEVRCMSAEARHRPDELREMFVHYFFTIHGENQYISGQRE